MPLEVKSSLEVVINSIPQRIMEYNNMNNGFRYNKDYRLFIESRENGIMENKSINSWLKNKNASLTIYYLLNAFGMNSRNSK